MISRINFLVAAGILLAAVLLLAGIYVVVKPIGAMAPPWAPYVMGAWLLISLGLVVSLLAHLHGSLQRTYGATRGRPRQPLGLAGQALLYVGHIVVAAGAYRWFRGDSSFHPVVVLVALLAYIGGIAATLADWRRSTV